VADRETEMIEAALAESLPCRISYAWAVVLSASGHHAQDLIVLDADRLSSGTGSTWLAAAFGGGRIESEAFGKLDVCVMELRWF
jgi:hypothetical protein